MVMVEDEKLFGRMKTFGLSDMVDDRSRSDMVKVKVDGRSRSRSGMVMTSRWSGVRWGPMVDGSMGHGQHKMKLVGSETHDSISCLPFIP